MKKQFLFLAMCIVTILSANAQTSVWDGSHTTWTNGNGTQANPYLIENAAQLAHLAYIVNNGIGAGNGRIVGSNTYWKLMTNIDLNSRQWMPIGYYNSATDYYIFGGNFDGNNYTIANLYINSSTLQRVGLFGYTSSSSIKNVGVISGSITASLYAVYAAGIVGYTDNTVIDNCYNKINISSCGYSGGIVGRTNFAISNCYNTGSIYSFSPSSYYYYGASSYYYSGGIAGYSTSTINNCYNTGSISSSSSQAYYITYSYCGGIAGYSTSQLTIVII